MKSIDEMIAGVESTSRQSPKPTEAAFKEAWQAYAAMPDIFESALVGGLIADRLSWVFLAAYQSAVRSCFDNLSAGRFVSYAASEDRTGEYPGTTIDGEHRLQGNKSWIAASATVDDLLVTVGAIDNVVHVPVDREGISLSHREAPSFLGDMSQGMASFHNVQLDDADTVRQHRVHDFRMAEPFYVTVSVCGYLLRLTDSSRTELIDLLESLQRLHLEGFARDAQALLDIYQAVKAIGRGQAEDSPSTDWAANGGLLGMYRRNLEAIISA